MHKKNRTEKVIIDQEEQQQHEEEAVSTVFLISSLTDKTLLSTGFVYSLQPLLYLCLLQCLLR